jgi:DNA-binding transcriptional LysR family regulator
MPEHVVADMIAAGRLKALQVEDDPTPQEGLTIYAAHKRNRSLGPGGKWLLDDLRQRLAP